MREWSAHSYEKLAILGDYLPIFVQAAKGARNRVYIDAFAGETENTVRDTDRTFPGSAECALSVSPPFTHIRFFELNRKRARSLERLIARFPGQNARVIRGDCNETMLHALSELPAKAPTFAFLDPDGMELRWNTIRAIADHKREYAERTGKSKVEMWILFSSSGIVRMLGKNRKYAESRGFPQRIADLYGAWGPWETIWHTRHSGEICPGDAKKAYLWLYMDRLAELGYRHLLVRPIHTRGESELYAMIFATDNLAGESIMRWAQEKDRVRPESGTLFDIEHHRPGYEDLHTGWRQDFPIELAAWRHL